MNVGIKAKLDEDGYVVIPNILTSEEIKESKDEFYKWYKGIPNLETLHEMIDFNGIFKHHEVGHQRFAWLLRTNEKIQNIFKEIWDCDELVCSFDGCCYYPSSHIDTPHYWIHTDQAGNKKGLQCVQSFVSLTDNKERTFVVYKGSHKLHEDYFKDCVEDGRDFSVIDEEYTAHIEDKKEYLDIKAGSLVIWDSRTFHQNTCATPLCEEERLVQYLCYLPKNNEKNTEEVQLERRLYYQSYRTTNHWPYPMSPIPLQPNYYNYLYNDNLKIDYNKLLLPDLSGLEDKIEKLI